MQVLLEHWLRNWDEAWYGEITKQMAVGGHGWLMPWWNGRYYFDHPPLYFWLSGLVVKLFGLGEWQVRIVSVMAGLGVILLTYVLGKKLFNRRVGILASLVLVSLAQVVVRFSHGNLDALMVVLFLATFYWWLKQKWIESGITLGLGFLVKGWLLGLFPVGLIVAYELLVKKSLPVRRLAGIVLLGAGVFLMWVIPAALKFGKPMVDRYLLAPDAGRLAEAGKNFSLKFGEHLVRDGKWWLILVGLVAVKRKLVEAKGRRILMALGGVCFGFIIGLNFVDEKSDWYILPAYPLLAIAWGYMADRLIRAYGKMALGLVGLLVVLGLANAYRVETLYPDRSRVGADLGKLARQIIPKGETVVLDDHDFTAFLYYSDAGMVYVPSQEDGGKAGEWWTIRYSDLPKLVEEKAPVWIVTANPAHLPQGLAMVEMEEYQGYKFLRVSPTRLASESVAGRTTLR